ncbi:MAG: T9SS type A sorting domain-containing protein, partial [Flavobacteriales bacterium]|nr:T9SS type A sorting domain-containing protein [Flavobacteriales bacterium]
VNGINVGNFTVFGGGANTETFNVCTGDNIELLWNVGGFDNEVSFDLLDGAGATVFSQGGNPTPGSIYTGTASCPPGPNNPSSLNNIPAVTYIVTVIDVNGCSIADTINVVNNVTFSTSGIVSDENCGLSDGAIDLTTTGGTTPFTFSWSNGPTTEDIAGIGVGTYIVTSTDASGCAVIDTFNVNNIIAFTTSTVTNNDTCNLGNGAIDLTLVGGVAPITYVWSTGASTEDVSGLMSGTYTVTSTDANGCAVSDTITVNNINTFTTSGTIIDDNCSTGIGSIDLTLIGGNAPFTFNWDNGATTEDITGLNAGTYIVTSTDASGCAVTDTFIVTNTTTFSYTATTSPDSCNLTNGAIDLTLTGGTAPITYAWSNGATTEDISGLSAGSYTVTITDGSGCIDIAVFAVNSSSSITSSGIVTNDSCGLGIGAIDLTVGGGIPCCSYTLDMQDSFGDGWDGASIDITINGSLYLNTTVLAGNSFSEVIPVCDGDLLELVYNIGAFENEHSYTLIDANGTTVLTETAPPTPGLSYSNTVSCPAGSPIVTYNWSNGATTEDLASLNAGTYTVTITDTATGCSLIDTFTVTNTSTYTAAGVTTDDNCNTGIGAIDLSVAGGTAPFTFAWSNGANTEDLSGLTGGIYTVTITDASGCIEKLSFTVNNTATFNYTSVVTNDSCSVGMGAIDITVTGGTAPFTFAWSNGANTEDIAGLSSGMYTVTITDGSGCAIVDSFAISNTVSFTASGIVTDASCLACTDGSIDLTATGDAPFTFTWSNGANTEDINNLLTGGYSVIITGASGCQDSLYFYVNYPVGIDPTDINWFVNLYPNPANDEFTLDYNFRTNDEVRFTVFNIIGELVHDEKITKAQGKITVDAQRMDPGIYFIQLTGKDRKETLKLIIAK